tara:strand:+ start:40829 stop:41188 length:360 start_codon:yes stop_codon:yes gene_type:complete
MRSFVIPGRRAILAGVVALCLPLVAMAQQADISGSYLAEGRNPDGSAYQGVAQIAERDGSVQIDWTVGGQNYSGSGVRDGLVVVVNWGESAPVVYVVMANGDLHGTWNNGTALERLSRR